MILVTLPLYLLLAFAASYFLRGIIWRLRHVFLILNPLLWHINDPFRWFMRDTRNAKGRALYITMFFGVVPYAWFLFAHFITTPLRIVQTVYFNFLLLWSLTLYDTLAELFSPKLGGVRHKKGGGYKKAWILGFPKRLLHTLIRSGSVVVSSILMAGVEILLPVYTMYHGTEFRGVATDITQQGRWLVGDRDFAGSGVYFGIAKKTAEHYEKAHANPSIVMARVCLVPLRSAGSLAKEHRELVGGLGRGERLSEEIGGRYRASSIGAPTPAGSNTASCNLAGVEN